MTIDYSLIGRRIQERRVEKGTTQEHFAEYMDVSVGYVSQIERGITKLSLDRLSKIADYLNCDMAALISGSSSKSNTYLDAEFKQMLAFLNDNEKQMLYKLVSTYVENKNKHTS